MKKIFFLIALALSIHCCFAQQPFYEITQGVGNGIRFWQDNTYKMHMGNSAEYQYGPVTDFSIKVNMSGGTPARGWTWGVAGLTPVAAINTLGNMQIAGSFMAGGVIGINGVSVINTGNNANDIYISSRVVRNESTVNQDGMYLNFNSNGGASAHLRLFANGTAERLRIDANTGNVGIGTTTPGARLVVQGSGGVSTDLAVNGRIVTGDASNMGGVWIAGAANMFMGQVSTTAMGWWNNGAWRMIADNNGNIGIGTLTPTQKLTVSGTIYGKEIKVDLNVPGPDYVFAKEYALPSLDSVQLYINQNKHLPEIPSAREMETNGINLGEMNMLLLKKVEELTLYMIEARKEMQDLKKENNEIKQMIKR